jgi:hypothetical protein
MVTIAVDGGHGWYWSVFSIGRIDIDIGVSPLDLGIDGQSKLKKYSTPVSRRKEFSLGVVWCSDLMRFTPTTKVRTWSDDITQNCMERLFTGL